ncbi:hypothetical protein V6N11_016557 [Hibiscus sabdariffa]|uniref:Protein kinase domain-containing protein n=1 Tax=Hibiscus sabdariffa TaxID=183260 RepID=A0ABR2TVK0_9ROSI
MNCFPCFSSKKNKEDDNKKDIDVSTIDELKPTQQSIPENMESPTVAPADYENNSSIKAYNFRELASATKNFRQECLLGEGSLGKVYRGTIQATGQEVAVKQLDRNAMEGGNEFFVEVGQLSLLQHPNLVSLVGYCADGDQRLLVYEFMPGGSLEHHLHGGKHLDWTTRMKIAHGTAQGLQYLHEKAKPPIIYRDLRSSKVLLDDEFNPKLSNIGLDKIGSSADGKMPMQSKMMDNNGYNAPECVHSGTINAHTDVYSFGVVLLELISGRKAIDPSRPAAEQNLVAWAQPIFKEPKNFPQMADPKLKRKFPERGLNQAVAMAAMCVQEEAAARPLISDLASVLSFLSIPTQESNVSENIPSSGEPNENESTDDESGSDGASSTRSSSVDRSLSRNGDRSLSHKSSGRSMSSFGSSNRRGRHRESGSDVSEGNSEDDEGNASSSNEKADEHRDDSMKSVGETDDSSVKKSRKKKSSENIPKGQRSSSKKKKSKDANDSSRHKSRRKKHSDKDDDDSPRGSEPEN